MELTRLTIIDVCADGEEPQFREIVTDLYDACNQLFALISPVLGPHGSDNLRIQYKNDKDKKMVRFGVEDPIIAEHYMDIPKANPVDDSWTYPDLKYKVSKPSKGGRVNIDITKEG